MIEGLSINPEAPLFETGVLVPLKGPGRPTKEGSPGAVHPGQSESLESSMEVLWNRKPAQYERQQEQPWHRIALEKAARGFTAKEIAIELGCSPTAVQDILRQKQYQERQVDLIKRNAAEDDKVHEAVKANVLEAINTCAEIMRDKQTSPAYRIAAAKELLDRRYGKPNQPVNRNTDVDLSNLSDAELAKMLQGN